LWFGSQLPVLISLLAVIGALWIPAQWVIAWKKRTFSGDGSYFLVPVIIAAVGIPVASGILGVTLYSGVRQLLFLTPVIAILAIAALRMLLMWLGTKKSQLWTSMTWAGVALGLTVPLLGQIMLFPYSYTYFNTATALRPINGNWDLDGWWLSGRELVESGPLAARTVCVESEQRPVADCVKPGILAPFLPLTTAPTSLIDLADDEYLALTRFEGNLGNDTCRDVYSVDRMLYWRDVTLSRASVCAVGLSEMPDGGITFSSDVPRQDPGLLWGEDPYLKWGWGGSDPNGVAMTAQSAVLGFEIGEDQLGQDSILSLTGRLDPIEGITEPIRVSINGVEVGNIGPTAGGEDVSQSFLIPAGAPAGNGQSRVLVRFDFPEVSVDGAQIGFWPDISTGFRLQSVDVTSGTGLS
jgi:hypothetical protein